MSSQLITQLDAGSLIKESEIGEYIPLQLAMLPNGTARGLGFPKVTTGNNTGLGYLACFVIPPGGVTLTTGIEVYLNTTDDGAFAADLGSTAVFGVSVKKITAASTGGTFGTEVTATITMAATSGVLVQTIVSVPNADLNSAAVGDTIALRIRRVGTSASDLVAGRVLMPAAHVSSY